MASACLNFASAPALSPSLNIGWMFPRQLLGNRFSLAQEPKSTFAVTKIRSGGIAQRFGFEKINAEEHVISLLVFARGQSFFQNRNCLVCVFENLLRRTGECVEAGQNLEGVS